MDPSVVTKRGFFAAGDGAAGPHSPTVRSPGKSSQRAKHRKARLLCELNVLTEKLDQLDQRQVRLESVLTQIRDLLLNERTIKDWYSPGEVAEILGKKPYTVREWCRLRRINSRKRPTGRGDSEEWEISHEELERIKAHGLLPIPAKY
jgi:hypothetical protein